MEQKYVDFNDLIDDDDDFGGDDNDNDMDVDEDDQPQHVIVHVPVPMMHIFEAKELMIWCALLVLLAFAARAFGTFVILKGAGAL